jgi:hypothetical protein
MRGFRGKSLILRVIFAGSEAPRTLGIRGTQALGAQQPAEPGLKRTCNGL